MNDIWQRIRDAADLVIRFLTDHKNVFHTIWEGSREEAGTHLFLILCAIALTGGAVYFLISFLRASWKEKLHILFVIIIAVLVVGVILWWGLSSSGANI